MKEDKTFRIVLFLALAAVAVYFLLPVGGRERAVVGAPDPIQLEASGSEHLNLDGYDLTIAFRYSYDISALVVSTCDYSSSSIGDKLSPKDLALAWGKVAEYNKKVDFNWSQSGRWYYWRVDNASDLDPVGGVMGVNTHSANTHIIPADSTVRNAIGKIKQGDYVRLTGYLVSVNGKNSSGTTFTWNSSTTRNDTGDGACEVMYVKTVEWLK